MSVWNVKHFKRTKYTNVSHDNVRKAQSNHRDVVAGYVNPRDVKTHLGFGDVRQS